MSKSTNKHPSVEEIDSKDTLQIIEKSLKAFREIEKSSDSNFKVIGKTIKKEAGNKTKERSESCFDTALRGSKTFLENQGYTKKKNLKVKNSKKK